jgi:hypothetical protein
MKKNIALILAASTLLLAGCCSTHHVTQWEYKTYGAAYSSPSAVGDLNKLAAEGWIVDKVLYSDIANSTILLKRPRQ